MPGKQKRGKEHSIYRNLLVFLICVLFLILLLFVSLRSYNDANKNFRIHTANAIDIIDQRMTSLFFELNNLPRDAGNDILFVSKLSSIRSLINKENDAECLRNTEKDFFVFMQENTIYYQLKYIDENGMEIIKVEFDGKDYNIVPPEDLQKNEPDSSFERAQKLKGGEVFISRLDLNIKNGGLENRGSSDEPVYVPIIRYATPLFNDLGIFKGVLISNIYTDYFLEDIRRAQREGEAVFLVDNHGYYLAHPDRDKEFSFMFEGRNSSLYADYPDVAEDILSGFNERLVETEDFVFVFRHIYPSIGSLEVYEGAKKLHGENPENTYFWVLVSVSDKADVREVYENIQKGYLSSIIFLVIIILIILILVFVLSSFKFHL
jgi:methyl-accepting chemotaxis protein